MTNCINFEHLDTEIQSLIRKANESKNKAYAPYSRFQVGAAIVFDDTENVYTGCNIENASFGLTNCAERTAVFKAVSDGCRERIKKLVVIASGDDFTTPCGACLQVLSEFGDEFEVYLSNSAMSQVVVTSFNSLFPKPPFPNKDQLIH